MGLLSIFERKGEPAASAGSPADTVGQARTRARQRLIGAAVLVAVGVIGFPLVFETQPRPIPVDIPIELPRKEGAAPLVMPPVRAPAASGNGAVGVAKPAVPIVAPTQPPATVVAAKPGRPTDASEVITESREDAGKPVASPSLSPPPRPATAPARPVAKPAPAAVNEPTPKPALAPATKLAAAPPAATTPDSDRARALLDGKPATAPDGERYIVQVGAFADANSARDARAKVEKLGLKTYTQSANTPAGNRIRVRIGPFTSRTEADRALARAKSAGLAAVVLTL